MNSLCQFSIFGTLPLHPGLAVSLTDVAGSGLGGGNNRALKEQQHRPQEYKDITSFQLLIPQVEANKTE